MGKKVLLLLKRNKVLVAIVVCIFYYYLIAKVLYSYEYDIWDQQTWGYTAIFKTPFIMHIKNIGNSGNSIYGPLADLYITLEAFLSLFWDKIILNSSIDINVLSPSFMFVRKSMLGLIHILFSLFLYKKLLKIYGNINNKNRIFTGFIIWLFNPLSLLVGTVWGQLDEIMVILIITSFIYLIEEKLIKAGVILGCVFSFKSQGILVLPLILLVTYSFVFNKSKSINLANILKNYCNKITIIGFSALATFLIIHFPFFIHEGIYALRPYLEYRIFPFVQMGSFNLWMLIFGDASEVNDNTFMIGNLSFHTAAVIFFVFFIINILFISLRKFIKNVRRINLENVMELLYFIYGALFIFMTEVHERYIVYMYLPYLITFIIKFIRKNIKSYEYFIFIIFTITSSLNLLYGLYKGDLKEVYDLSLIDIFVRVISLINLEIYIITLFLWRVKEKNSD